MPFISTRKGFCFNSFETRIEYNRVSIPLRRLDSGCQVMGIVIHLKNTRNLFLILDLADCY